MVGDGTMKVGDVRIADDEDYKYLIDLVTEDDGWKKEYSKKEKHISMTVYTKADPETVRNFKLFKVSVHFPDVLASTLYDVLLDGDYRKRWDTNMTHSYDLCCINPNNDIGYYALKCPKPLKNRDFVMQRSWLQTKSHYMIISHSIFHDKIPPQKGYIRATTYLCGYVITPDKNNKGCRLGYVSHVDPKGNMPSWVVNKATTTFVPKQIRRLHKSCLLYHTWKSSETNPDYKPWLYPEQISLPKVNLRETALKQYEEQVEEEEEEDGNGLLMMEEDDISDDSSDVEGDGEEDASDVEGDRGASVSQSRGDTTGAPTRLRKPGSAPNLSPRCAAAGVINYSQYSPGSGRKASAAAAARGRRL